MSDILAKPSVPRSGWIPWVFVGGMALVVAVNLVLVWFALTTFTGVTVGQSYDRGRTYNQVINTAARQEALGWRSAVTLRGAALYVAVTDRDGTPLPGRAEGRLLRPLDGTTHALDVIATATGNFRGDVGALQPGQWDVQMRFLGPGGEALDIRHRIILP